MPESIVGTIEDVEGGKKEKFKGMSELWEKLKRSDDNDSERKKANPHNLLLL